VIMLLLLLLLLLGRHRFSHGFNPWSCFAHSPTWGPKPLPPPPLITAWYTQHVCVMKHYNSTNNFQFLKQYASCGMLKNVTISFHVFLKPTKN
jgi:hypothetical protein